MAESHHTLNKIWTVDERRASFSSAPLEGERVGSFLRRWREGRGWSLAQVSGALRIRLAYLEAIESGQFDSLPGRPYVLGFVRSYAELLEVNVEAVLGRLRAEMAHVPDQPVLVFPEPPAERSIPGGALVSFSVCALIAVYGVWYFQTAQHHVRREAVTGAPPIVETVETSASKPVELAALPAPQPPAPMALVTVPAAPATAALQRATIPGNAAEPHQQQRDPRAETTVSSPVARPMASGPATGAPASPGHATERAPSAGNSRFSDQEPGPARPQADRENSIAHTAPPPLPSAAMIGSFRSRMPVDLALPAPVMRGAAPVQAAEVSGRGLGWLRGSEVAGPIVLRAVEPSWIEIRSADGEVVHGRLLKAGDSYTVPQRPELRLTTGNAGGLEVMVGGAIAPRLGPRGAVIRDIALDASRLIAGTATARN